MGSSQSKAPSSVPGVPAVLPSGLPATPSFTAPDAIVDKIRGLGEVIGHFNNNDTTSIEGFIDNYNKQVSNKEKIDIAPEMKSMMLNFHNQVLEVIDQELGSSSTPEEKKEVLKSRLKDNKQLNDMLKMYYDKKMMDFESKVMADATVQSNPEVMNTVKTIMGNVKSLKVKYKFFEYKYIQLNVFLIVFIQYVYNTMSKFIVDVIAYNQTRDAIRQEMTKKIFKATQEILGASDIQMKPEDADAVNKMIANLQQKISKDQVEIQDLSNKLKTNSLSDLLNFVLTSDETLATHIMDGVDKFKINKQVRATTAASNAAKATTAASNATKASNAASSSKPTNAATTPFNLTNAARASNTNTARVSNSAAKTTTNAAASYKPSNVSPFLLPITDTPTTTTQQGGFVRGASMFPQAFFELSK